MTIFRDLLGIPQQPVIVTAVLDGSGDRIGGVFVAPKAGTIDRIACYCTGVSNPVSTDARLESVSAGAPTGTLIATNTNGLFTPAASTLHVITLTASRVVAAGDLIACVLNAPTAGGSNTQTFNGRNSPTNWGAVPTHFPRSLYDLSAGTYTQQGVLPCVVPVYSDGSYVVGCIPRNVETSTDFNNTSTPDERGNRWTQVGNYKLVGARFITRGIAASDNCNIKVYPTTADNASPLATFAITASTFFFNTSNTGVAEVFWAPIDLVDGTDYRLTLQPSTANTIRAVSESYNNQQIREAVSHYYSTTRTRTADGDDGGWTDVLTDHHLIWPIFSDFNASGGSGGVLIGGMRGGFVN